MAILAEQFVHVIGVDTHKLSLTAAAVNASGGCLELLEVRADSGGHRQLMAMASRYGGPVLWPIEGTGSYGASLTEHLLSAGQTVTEVDRPKRPPRKRGKSDEIDALRAARDALAMRRLNPPRRRGEREQLRILLITRQELVGNRTRLVNHLSQLVVTASENLRARFLESGSRSHSGERLVRKCLAARPSACMSAEDRTRLAVMHDLARVIHDLTLRANGYELQIQTLVEQMAPGLRAQPGLGTLTAAQIMVAWSHAGRLPTDAAFAALAGVAPIPASSGQTVRHRLNRGGDRKLNAALYVVVLARCRYDQTTRDYVARRSAEGKTHREIRRCLKRYLARQLFRFLNGLDRA
jgi:transposase